MPKKRFVLDTMPPRLLEIAWKGGWFRVESDIVIRCDGIMVGSNLQPDDLFTGHDIVVADGTPLTVRLVDHRIQVFSNEARLVEKESQWALVMLFGSGLISLVIGLLAIILGVEPFATPLRYPSSIAWITVRDRTSKATEELAPAAVFVFIGLSPNSGWLPDAIKRDAQGFIVTSPTLETSMPGVFAAGDVRKGSTKQAASAAGEGATAALLVREYLKDT